MKAIAPINLNILEIFSYKTEPNITLDNVKIHRYLLNSFGLFLN